MQITHQHLVVQTTQVVQAVQVVPPQVVLRFMVV